MNKILFTHSYFLRFDPKQWKTAQPYAPLGTLYAASLMRENGFEISFYDTMFAENAHTVRLSLDDKKPDFFVIYDDGFNYLTKMCLTNMREAAFEMIKIAKKKNCIVIVSGSDSTDHFEKYLEEGADFILLGEAEQTLLELVNAIKHQRSNFLQIQGIAFKQSDAVIKTQKRNVMRDLDALPFPAWDIINMQPYKNMWMQGSGFFSMNMGTTRGCPFKCNWCAKPIYGNRYNSRSPENVATELKMLKEKFDCTHIWFCDDIFGLKPGWLKALADILEREKIKLKFKIQSRADLLVQEDYIKDLARAGCDEVWLGAESGSQKILDAMDKGITVTQIYDATNLLKHYNIKPCFFIQFGYLGETKNDIKHTIAMINELLPYNIGISVSYPLPGTVFYEKVKQDLKEKANWTDSDELRLMFQNTYKAEFYKQLHRYVHKNYQKHLALNNLKNVLRHPAKISFVAIKKAASFFWYVPVTFFVKQKLLTFEKRQ